jgi:uncharacterized protein
MRFSKYNIFSRVRDSENYFILNLLTGNADILSPEEAGIIKQIIGNVPVQESDFTNSLSENGYLLDEKAESHLFRSRYLDFIDSRDTDEIQIFFVTNYTCNFACSYCYQDQYVVDNTSLSSEVTDAFFRYVNTQFAGRRRYITLFGGEPLLNSNAQKDKISYILEKAEKENIEICIVTNGYSLSEYADMLRGKKIREVQVTLDGTAEVHNSRRFLKGGGGTFKRIVEGIEKCLDYGIGINLRMVADSQNIDNLPDLARFAINRGWTKNHLFKTQIGRNYELHHCQSAHEKLFTRVSLYERIFDLIKEHPFVTEFYKPAYSVSKFLSENGELPDPLFDSCPACKTEWAMDYTGKIYSCTATVGKSDEVLGTFYPEVTLRNEVVEEWQNRDVTSIEKCSSCSLQLACGGGCGSVAKNSSGKICSPDCRPVTELLGLGFAAYFKNE